MNENKMLNDKPIFVAKRRIFRSLILVAIALMFALVLYLLLQEQEHYKLKEVVGWFGDWWIVWYRWSFRSLSNAYI